MREADATCARDSLRAQRPERRGHSLQVSAATRTLGLQAVYWFGFTAMWAGLGSLLAGRLQYQHLVAPGTEGVALLRMTAAGMAVAIVVQPAAGALSDRTASRWGRRMPYIAAGAVLDVVFLAGIAWSVSVVAIAGFYLLLQLSSNAAQGPYQGYLPDLVSPDQIGLASGVIGLMIILGNAAGYAVGALGIATGQYPIATLFLAVLEGSAVILLIARFREPAAPAAIVAHAFPPRTTLSARLRDLAHTSSFTWFVASRLFVLTGYQMLLALAPFYLARSFRLSAAQAGIALVLLVGTVSIGTLLSVVPAARLSDRQGRRPIIWLACFVGGTGLLVCAIAPVLPIAFVGAIAFGIAGGAFLAVDWALLSELVPHTASAGYMGLSNVATASSGLVALTTGGVVMDLVGGTARSGDGPRAALLVGVTCFAVGALLLRGVKEPRQLRSDPGKPLATGKAEGE